MMFGPSVMRVGERMLPVCLCAQPSITVQKRAEMGRYGLLDNLPAIARPRRGIAHVKHVQPVPMPR